jgi:hypothetical protein
VEPQGSRKHHFENNGLEDPSIPEHFFSMDTVFTWFYTIHAKSFVF